MIKVDIKFKNKSWAVKEPLNSTAFNYNNFNSVLKSVQKQTNAILTQLVEEECANGKEISESESDCDEDSDNMEPEQKRQKT
ncbi:hypothetical protein QE152_g12438 [Popillia japonica]|uniref:Uncharacterized protein n=1 Tax=Popillia japonica TaxID=7064 RepID=A0AAW1LQ82_POPJA